MCNNMYSTFTQHKVLVDVMYKLLVVRMYAGTEKGVGAGTG